MRTRTLVAISACTVTAWTVVGVGYAAAASAPSSMAPVTDESSITVLAQPDDDQLTPQSPGSPSGTSSEVEYTPPPTGGVRWDEFGGDPTDAPTDMRSFVNAVLGWMKTLAGIAGVLGLLTVAGLMIIGLRGRSEAARKAFDGVWPVLLGTLFAGSAYTITSLFT